MALVKANAKKGKWQGNQCYVCMKVFDTCILNTGESDIPLF